MKSALVSIDKLRTGDWLNLLTTNSLDMYRDNPIFKPLSLYCDFNRHKLNINPDRDYKYIDISSLDRTLGVIKTTETYQGEDLPARGRRRVEKGDLLLSTIGYENNGLAYMDKNLIEAVASNVFLVLTAKGISPEYLYFCLRLPSTLEQIKGQARGNISPRINSRDIEDIRIPIVEEALQAEITDKVRTYLDTVNQVEAREDVLADYFGKSDLEAVPKIFTVSPADIKERWDVQYLQFMQTESEGLKLEDILVEIRVGYTVFPRDRGQVTASDADALPLLGPKEIEVANINPLYKEYVALESKALDTHLLQVGDLVMVRIGTSLGRTASVSGDDKPMVANQHLLVIRPDLNRVSPSYLMWFFTADKTKDKLLKLAGGTYQPSITIGDVKRLSINLPEMEEQVRLVAQIENRLNAEKCLELLQELEDLGKEIVVNKNNSKGEFHKKQ